MRVAIAGGGLQGVELCWLARKAGWETLLVDRRPAPPALRLADGFVQADVTRLEAEGREAAERMAGADIVIPALEDAAALEALGAWCARRGLPFAFDPEAYAVTASKLRSRELFLRCGTPIPRPFASGEPQGPARNRGCAVQDAGESPNRSVVPGADQGPASDTPHAAPANACGSSLWRLGRPGHAEDGNVERGAPQGPGETDSLRPDAAPPRTRGRAFFPVRAREAFRSSSNRPQAAAAGAYASSATRRSGRAFWRRASIRRAGLSSRGAPALRIRWKSVARRGITGCFR